MKEVLIIFAVDWAIIGLIILGVVLASRRVK